MAWGVREPHPFPFEAKNIPGPSGAVILDTGAVILDTSAIKVLEPPDIRDRVRSALTASDSAIWPSALNVLEIVKTANLRVRNRLLATTLALSGTQHLLPAPMTLLARVGRAILDGEHGFETTATGLEWIIHEPERLTEKHIAAATQTIAESQVTWDTAHRAARKAMRSRLKKAGAGDSWGSIPQFLDRQWMKVEQLDTFIEHMWDSFGLERPPPFDLVLQNEAWRLYFEGFGATVYEHSIPNKPPAPAHVVDVLQLVYMAGTARRTLVTDDIGLLRVAKAVLIPRYSSASVLTTTEFLAQAP